MVDRRWGVNIPLLHPLVCALCRVFFNMCHAMWKLFWFAFTPLVTWAHGYTMWGVMVINPLLCVLWSWSIYATFLCCRLHTICSIINSRMRIILSLNVVHIDLFNKRAWLEILSVCTIRHLRIGSSDKRAWSEIH